MKKKTLIFIIVFMFIFLIMGNININLKASGLGTIKYTYSRTILKDMEYTYVESNNGDPQRAYVLTYNPKTTGVDALAVFGEEYFGGDKISHNVALAKSMGYEVIAGVNASPFDTSNGVTVGTTIQNGRVVVTSNGPLSTSFDNFAILDDGSAYIGHPNLGLTFNVNGGSNNTITYLNRQKKTASNDIYLISRDFASDTKTLAESCEAVLNITSGDLKVNSTIVCSVVSVNENTTRTKLSDNQLVLVGPSKVALGNIKSGDTVNIKIQDNDSAFDWTRVTQTISGFYQILGINSYTGKDCKQALATMSERNDRHPRTTLGYKANGEIVIYVADGRQTGLAIGMTDTECAEYMESLGCVAAIRMDGGGSSNLSIRLPGDDFVTTVNVPSDGEERSDADAFLFVLKKDYNTNVDNSLLLHAYPNDIKLLENTVTDIIVKATDENYNKKATPDYTMTVNNGVGEIVDGNKFKARSGAGNGSITIKSGNVSTNVNVSVSNNVDEIYPSINNLALSPQEKVSLGVKAYYQSNLLVCSNDSFTWTCDSNIGSVDSNGNFTATSNASQSGYITIAYKNLKAKILVSIGQLPQEISGFETEKEGVWKNVQLGGGSGSCSINTNLKYVRFGNKSLKIDFKLAGTTGTVGTQIGKSSNVAISGTPTAIGMWVYATSNAYGAWIRMQYAQSGSSGALYADFGHIDWQGWKYLEAPVDTTVKYPISIKYLIRIMAVSEEERIDGTIYVDGLRAVYGFSNDDFTYPEIKNITPEQITTSSQQSISFDAIDHESGINKDAITFTLDNTEITNLIFNDIPDGFNVSFTPSALIPLTEGNHNVKVRIEDNGGNFIIKEWTFSLDKSLPSFTSTLDREMFRINDETEYVIASTNSNFEKIILNIYQNNISLEDIIVPNNYTKNIITSSKNLTQVEIINNGGASEEIVKLKLKATDIGAASINFEAYYTNENHDGLKIKFDLSEYDFVVSDNAESILEYVVSKVDSFFE